MLTRHKPPDLFPFRVVSSERVTSSSASCQYPTWVVTHSFAPSFFPYLCPVHHSSKEYNGLYFVFVFLEVAKDYIKEAKAHVSETCQKMDSDLSLSSHYVDTQVSQRHVANRCSRNTPKTLDNELIVMGDTDRKQSLVERAQVSTPHLLHCRSRLWLSELWHNLLLSHCLLGLDPVI